MAVFEWYDGGIYIDTGVTDGLRNISETKRSDAFFLLAQSYAWGQSHERTGFVSDLKVNRVCGKLKSSLNKTSPISKYLLDVCSLKLTKNRVFPIYIGMV